MAEGKIKLEEFLRELIEKYEKKKKEEEEKK